MAHQDFEEIRDEVMKRLGRSGVTAFEARAQHLVDASYREICQTWFHHELVTDPIPTDTLAAASDNVPVPTDCYLLFGVRLKSGSTLKGRPGYMRPMNLFGRATTTAGRPEHYTRFGDKVYFERPADASYTVELFSYARPTDPDFATPGEPEIDELFDEIIIESAVARGQGSLWRPDLSMSGRQSMAEFWSRVAGEPIGSQRDSDEEDASDLPYAGGLG